MASGGNVTNLLSPLGGPLLEAQGASGRLHASPDLFLCVQDTG